MLLRLNTNGGAGDDHFDTAILGLARCGTVVRHGVGFAVAHCGDIRSGDPIFYQEVLRGPGPVVAQFLVQLVAADGIGIALNLQLQVRVLLQDGRDFGQ